MNTFVDEKIDVKIKISALWVVIMICYLYNDFFSLFKPGSIEQISMGFMGPFPVTQGALISSTILMAIPTAMIFLSLVMKPSINRIVNIILSFLYIVVMVVCLKGEWIFYILMGIIEIVF